MQKRLVVVTGSARGFGAAVVEVFAEEGWSVVAAGRTPVDQDRDRDRDNVIDLVWDVTNDDTSALVAAVDGRPVDLLVNNSGRGVPGGPLSEVRVDDLLSVLDVNVGGVLRACKALLPNLTAAKAPLVVNVSSRLVSLNDQSEGRYAHLRTSYAYRISKAAQNMSTIALAAELGPHCRVIALHPGELATSMGQTSARTDPRVAAEELRQLIDRDGPVSSSFLRTTGQDIRW